MVTSLDNFSFGVIEGFFGRPWRWPDRYAYATFLQQNHYGYYIYAPKSDPFLRRRWFEPWPASEYTALKHLGEIYRQAGVLWGIGLTPFEIHFDFNDQAQERLDTKIDYLNTLQPDILAILFDDMRGDALEIARIQVDITHRIMNRSNARSFIMCPTYYSDAQVLDRIFGDRPPRYLETLGEILDPAVHVFWTGPEICSSSYPAAHLREITQKLGRKPFIWDNYPVNDSAQMSKFLHLRAFADRHYDMQDWTAGHAVNPMNQAYLSQIPLMTLALSYQQQAQYVPDLAWTESLQSLCGEPLATFLAEDIAKFQDDGLDKLSPAVREQLICRYQSVASPYSQELIDWLQGAYPFDPACLTE